MIRRLYLSGEQPAEAVPQSTPAPAVERDWNEVRSTVRAARNYGPVIEYDTLWSLARELRPDTSVSIQQMMLALLRTNPDAFSYGNINWLRKDAVLWMPNDFELQALTKTEAFAEVLAQNNFWRAERGYATIDTGLQTAAGTVEVDGGLRLVAVAEEDLEGDGTTATDPDGIAEAETLVLATEQVEELSLENIELEDKLIEAETIIEDLRRLVELKDDELAALQGHELSEQAEPGPDLVERLSSVYDSTAEILTGPKVNTALESAYNLARDYWYIALALLAALIFGGLLLRRGKAGDDPGEEASPAIAAEPDLAEALVIEKAVFPDDDNVDDADTAAEDLEFEEELKLMNRISRMTSIPEKMSYRMTSIPEKMSYRMTWRLKKRTLRMTWRKKTWCRTNLNSPGRILNLATGKTSVPSCREVLSEGNAAQREEARQLLEQAASE